MITYSLKFSLLAVTLYLNYHVQLNPVQLHPHPLATSRHEVGTSRTSLHLLPRAFFSTQQTVNYPQLHQIQGLKQEVQTTQHKLVQFQE